MAKKDTRPTAADLIFSIKRAIYEYRARNHGEPPAQVTMTLPVYARIMNRVEVYCAEITTVFGIPAVVTAGDGYHINLAEPEIQIYEEPEYVPKLHLPPDYVPRED